MAAGLGSISINISVSRAGSKHTLSNMQPLHFGNIRAIRSHIHEEVDRFCDFLEVREETNVRERTAADHQD